MHWVDYPIILNLLEYLIKHVMFTYLPYNLNGYKCVWIPIKGSDARKIYNIPKVVFSPKG
jgi:hypothetical protein